MVFRYSIVIENGSEFVEDLVLFVVIIQYILYSFLSLEEVIQGLRFCDKKVANFFLILQSLCHGVIDIKHLRLFRVVYDYVHFFVLELLEKSSATFTRVYSFGVDKATGRTYIHTILSIVIQFWHFELLIIFF